MFGDQARERDDLLHCRLRLDLDIGIHLGVMRHHLCGDLKERGLSKRDEITIDTVAKSVLRDDLRCIGVIGEDRRVGKQERTRDDPALCQLSKA
ncbi:unannotated protein [freshwater metagenome]|uniref:Unannotated protein n=1 Tax=freshwater metagenome TaxID=449393 RepID=A0A6J6DZA5_9ZZZZ